MQSTRRGGHLIYRCRSLYRLHFSPPSMRDHLLVPRVDDLSGCIFRRNFTLLSSLLRYFPAIAPYYAEHGPEPHRS